MVEEEEFDSSPRPAKKRRVSGAATKTTKKPAPARRASKVKTSKDGDFDDFIVPDDNDSPVAVKPKRGRPRKTVIKDSDDDESVMSGPSKKGGKGKSKSKKTNDSDGGGTDALAPAKKPRAKKKKQATTLDSDEEGSVVSTTSANSKGKRKQLNFDDFDEEGYAKPQKAEKPKYSIHIPTNDNLKDIYVDSNVPPPSTNPWEIRGAIWKTATPAVRSVFDVAPTKMAPPPPPVRNGMPQRANPRLPPRPGFETSNSNTSSPARTKILPPVRTDQVRPSLARFMAPGLSNLPLDIPDSDDLDPEDWAQFDEMDAASPVKAKALIVRPEISSAEAIISATTISKDLVRPASKQAQARQSDVPNSDEFDGEDWDELEEEGVRPPANQGLSNNPLRRHVQQAQSRQSDIPDSDNIDAESWNQLSEQATRPPPRVSGVISKVPRPAVSESLPSSTSLKTSVKPLAEPTPLAQSHADLQEDSIMVDDDDIDAEEWALLEINNIRAHVSRPETHKPTTKDGSSATPTHDVRKLVSTQSSARLPVGKRHATPQPGPFIEIDSEMSEGDDFSDGPSAKTTLRRPAAKPLLPVPLARPRLEQTHTSIPAVCLVDELADLPSDAFDDSEDDAPAKTSKNTVHILPQQLAGQIRRPNLAAPKTGLVQTTLFGSKAPAQQGASPLTTKKHNWPLATQKEAETHHKLDQDAVNTWVYPTNLGTIRDYQYNIVARGLFHNLLVALPTGLGKTFIAATVMLNWFRWAPESQIVFVAPTKPLVAQQIDACFNIVGIPRSQTVMLTGETKPAIRAEEWKEKRVFFMTPQTIINDLKHGYCDPKKIVLIVVDEAHRATGGYAYVEVIKFLRRFNQSFRVLALTATPGSTVEAVQQVIDGLDISRVEIRTETSIDIRQYVHARDIDTMTFDPSDEQSLVMELLSKAIQPVLTKLNGQNAYWVKDPMRLTAYGCTMAQRQWAMSDAGKKAPAPVKGMIASIFPVLASLAHGISLLTFHGIGSFYRAMVNFRNEVDGGQTRGKYAKQIRDDENFTKMMNTLQAWVRNPDFLGHPKLEYLRQIALNHFMDEGEKTRIMIFAHWRDSAEEIVRVLKRNEPMIRPHVFVGQAASKGSEGMNQKRQLEVIQDFKEGIYNTIVATSIGEEGLDIGEVDMIICYDASSSPIRMLQRMGRTGRKRKGNIRLLLMRGKEHGDFEKAKDNYEKMQSMISEGTRFQFHDDKSPRILPRGLNPTVDKRVVEIPVENSQAELPEPNRRKRVPKKPPKKFHMPDNVRTGFVNASRMDESDEAEETPRLKAKGKAKKSASIPKVKAPTPEPEAVPLPFLQDVVLNKVQERELERKYRYVGNVDEGVPTVTAPRLDMLGPRFPAPTKLVQHGRATLVMADMMRRIREMDQNRIERFKDKLNTSDLSSNVDDMLGDPESLNRSDDADISLPELPALAKKGGRKLAAAGSKAAPKPRAAAKPKAPPKPKATPKPRTRKAPTKATPRGKGARARVNSSDMEGDESEPEPTPANMRIGTQGIDLGSGDTMSGEEDEGEPDSELAEFVVGSSAPIEMISSSLPRIRDEDSDEDEDEDLPEFPSAKRVADDDDDDEMEEESDKTPVKRRLQNRKRQIVDDDSDE